jgi:cyclopropane fatty-acyl-phospholipid synthase-like methyltransferase
VSDGGYNERLFKKPGLRSYLHNSRFHWFRKEMERLGLPEVRMVELGCFDGKLLDFCPTAPVAYRGFDAGWEGGLQDAQKKYEGHPVYRFDLTRDASALHPLKDGEFNLAASMETLEHVPPALVDDYLAELARVTDGWFLVTVPNEKGPMLLAKWAAKTLFAGGAEKYTAAELVSATFGRLDRVERNEHKGFDYDVLIGQIGRHFEVVKVEAIPVAGLPLWTSFTVGIVARSRPRAAARAAA